MPHLRLPQRGIIVSGQRPNALVCRIKPPSGALRHLPAGEGHLPSVCFINLGRRSLRSLCPRLSCSGLSAHFVWGKPAPRIIIFHRVPRASLYSRFYKKKAGFFFSGICFLKKFCLTLQMLSPTGSSWPQLWPSMRHSCDRYPSLLWPSIGHYCGHDD